VRRWNSAGPDGLNGRRPGPRGRMRNWFRRHPFIACAIGFAGVGWVTWWEATRIETAQGTVAQGWGTGLVAGIAACLCVIALWTVVLRVTRGQQGRQQRALVPLSVITVASYVLCLRTTAAETGASGPYVVTTGLAVGEMAYVATYSAFFAGLIIWAAIRLYRLGRRGRSRA